MKGRHFFNELKRRDVFRVATAYAVSSWLIIQIVVSIFPYLGIDDFWITTIIVLLIIGFPIAVIAGWIYEMTPDGIRKTDEVEVSEAYEEYSDRKLNRIIIGVLATVILFMLVERVFFAEGSFIERNEQSASVAVLPFVNMSEDENNEYFSDGLSEELLNVLAKVGNLNVAGRTSSFKFKGQNENLTLIGEELNVDHIIEGSVRKSGNRIRITAQLVKVDDGFHVWSETYDRELTTENIFDIQDEISNAVLTELKVKLLGEERINTIEYTQDIEAYNFYLTATQLEKNRDIDELEAALENYKAAIRLDPNFALAYARIAWVYYLIHEYGTLTREELLPLMKENIDKAYSIDPNLGKAVLAEAVYYRYTREPEKGLAASERAIELIPNDPETWIVHRNALFFSTFNERGEEDWRAMGEAVKKAYNLDENNPAYANMYARILPGRDEHEEALEILSRINRLYPEFGPAFATKARIYSNPPYGELDKAFITVFEQYNQDPDDLTNMTALLDAAINVDLVGLEWELVKKILNNFEGNPNIMPSISLYYMKNGKITEFTELLNNLIEQGAPVPSEFYKTMVFLETVIQQDYQKAKRLLLEISPHYSANDFDGEGERMDDLLGYMLVMRKSDEDSVAMAFGEIICEKSETLKASEDAEIDKVTLDLYCMLAENRTNEALNIVEKLYFDYNSKYQMLYNMAVSPVYIALEDDPGYTEFKLRVEEDIEQMRENVISYLKSEGKWKEEWDTSE